MIHSMTAFGAARATSEQGWVHIELRALNNRYLDLTLRLPDELRPLEGRLRERLTHAIQRGKVEVRVTIQRDQPDLPAALDPDWLAYLAAQLHNARQVMTDVPAPGLLDLLQAQHKSGAQTGKPGDTAHWHTLGLEALDAALADFHQQRQREGAQLARAMLGYAQQMDDLVGHLQTVLPRMQADYRERLATKLRTALEAANPQGWTRISGAELSSRINQESLLFSLRVDVSEELTRLGAHVQELQRLLAGSEKTGNASKTTGSTGKRLDFLCQEMNREANTLGSKATALEQTQAAIDLKLLIEQLREQVQNIE